MSTHRGVLLAAGVALALGAFPGASAGVFPGATWTSRTPPQLGLDPVKLQQLQNLVGGAGMIVRDGYQGWAWGDLALRRNWASASKPALSTMLFLAVHQGLCATNSPMSLYNPGGSAKDRAITFHQLANMTSGYSRGEPGGAAWAYNDHAINLYGRSLYYGVFGDDPSAVFPSRLSFLQFQDAPVVSDVQFGRLVGVSVRDFARIGLLWLNRGNWNGTQRIASSFFDLVSNQVSPGTPRTSQDGAESWNYGTFGGGDDQTGLGPGHYGYNFWVNDHGLWPGLPSDLYQASGGGGQYVVTVIPSLGIVAAGNGAWGALPSPEALELLVDSAAGSAVDAPSGLEADSWGAIKNRFVR